MLTGINDRMKGYLISANGISQSSGLYWISNFSTISKPAREKSMLFLTDVKIVFCKCLYGNIIFMESGGSLYDLAEAAAKTTKLLFCKRAHTRTKEL